MGTPHHSKHLQLAKSIFEVRIVQSQAEGLLTFTKICMMKSARPAGHRASPGTEVDKKVRFPNGKRDTTNTSS